LGNIWGTNAESLINKGITPLAYWFESTSAHQNTTFMQKTMYKAVFFCVFLNKYLVKNAFFAGFGEHFGEQNHLKNLMY
jgi:hypothetical protein